MFGNINWNDADNVRRQILEIPAMVSKDEKYQNAMRNSDEQSARLESERALQQVIFAIMADNMELFKQFQDNPSFKKWLSDLVFNLTYSNDAGVHWDARISLLSYMRTFFCQGKKVLPCRLLYGCLLPQ